MDQPLSLYELALSARGLYCDGFHRRLWAERHLDMAKPAQQKEWDVMTEFFQTTVKEHLEKVGTGTYAPASVSATLRLKGARGICLRLGSS